MVRSVSLVGHNQVAAQLDLQISFWEKLPPGTMANASAGIRNHQLAMGGLQPVILAKCGQSLCRQANPETWLVEL